MRKSLLTTLYFPPTTGGISNYLWQICRHLPPDRIAVFAPPSSGTQEEQFTVHRKQLISTSPFIWPKWALLFFHLRKIMRVERASLIQVGQLLPLGTVALLIKKLYRVPFIVYVYGQDMVIMRHSGRKMKMIRAILREADGVVACSEYTRQLAIGLGASPSRSVVVYPCAADKLFPRIDGASIEKFQRDHHLSGKKVILSVGNLVIRKGQDMVMRALPEVIARVPEVHYIIVGSGPDESRLRGIVSDLKLGHYVTIYNKVAHETLASFYQLADVFAMPSRELRNERDEIVDVEGFGMVFLEANLYGKPVIGGRSGGVPEAIADGISGILVNPTDPHDIAAAAVKFLTDNSLSRTLGEQGRERTFRDFRWEREVEKLTALLI